MDATVAMTTFACSTALTVLLQQGAESFATAAVDVTAAAVAVITTTVAATASATTALVAAIVVMVLAAVDVFICFKILVPV